MFKSQEYVSESESGSSDSDVEVSKKKKVRKEEKAPPAKKVKKEKSPEKEKKKRVKKEESPEKEESPKKEDSWQLSRSRKVSINEFRGKKLIDIREYYEKDGKECPGRKGISLNRDQWNTLLQVADKVTKALDS